MPVVTVSEIYDLNTVQNKVGIIGIHTPSFGSIDAKWHGYVLNHRFFRILDCDIHISCASMLPLDPLGIGTEPGKVAPQDMMNPILYRAVSNDAWNLVVGRLYATESQDTIGSVFSNSIRAETDGFPNATVDQEKLYYSLLASDEWRKAMPQQGLDMRGLRPFCYPLVGIFGQGESGVQVSAGYDGTITATPSTGGTPSSVAANVNNPNSQRVFRGPAMSLPRFPCTPRGIQIVASDDSTVEDQYKVPTSASVPRIYCACVAMPPCRITPMYYRMKVSWRISFEEPVSILEKRNISDAVANADYYYTRSYDYGSAAKLADSDNSAVDTNTIDTVGFQPNLVMEM